MGKLNDDYKQDEAFFLKRNQKLLNEATEQVVRIAEQAKNDGEGKGAVYPDTILLEMFWIPETSWAILENPVAKERMRTYDPQKEIITLIVRKSSVRTGFAGFVYTLNIGE